MGKTVFQLSPDGGTTKYDLRDSNIAPIELDSAHASQPYAVNEEFVLDADGLLYEATSPISQGSAIVVYPTSGYNCKLSDSVTGQIKAVKDSLGTASTKNAISVVTDSSDLVESGAVKDIVGWGNKNKFPLTIDGIKAVNTSGTWSGNTYTIGNGTFELQSIDGKNVSKIVANKLASTIDNPALNLPTFTLHKGNYVLNGVPSGGSSSKYYCQLYANVDYPSGAGIADFGDGKEFTLTTTNTIQRGIISIRPNNVFTNLEFELMMCDADLIDKSYEPHHESVADSLDDKLSYADNGVLGAVNLLQNKMVTHTDHGVTLTVDSDRVITVNGTPSEDIYPEVFRISSASDYPLKEGTKYYLSGCPSGGSANTYSLVADMNYAVIGSRDYGDGVEITAPAFNTNFNVYLRLKAGAQYTNLKFKPMIALSATAPYAPFAMTNKELTEKKADTSVIAPVENGSTASQAYAVGSHAIRNGAFIIWKNAKAQGETINDASDYTAGDVADELEVSLVTCVINKHQNITINSSRNNLYRYGKLRYVDVGITVNSDINLTSSTALFALSDDAIGIFTFMVQRGSDPYEQVTDYSLFVNGSNYVFANNITIPAGDYIITGFYLGK